MILVIDNTPSESKSLMELKARKNIKPAAAPQTLQDRINDVYALENNRSGPRGVEASGAAAGAGVLNAMDEGGEGVEEADVPREFEYHSDNEGEE